MLAKTLIDNLLLEMPQFKLTSGDPNKDAAYSVPGQFAVTVKSQIEPEPPWRLSATAYARAHNGQEKSFAEYKPMDAADSDALTQAYRKYERARRNQDLLPVSWFHVKAQLEQKYEDDLFRLEQGVRFKAENWWHDMARANPIHHMPRVDQFITGIQPTRLIPSLTPFKYVWVRSSDDPARSSEELAAFMEQKTRPGERLYKLVQSSEERTAKHQRASAIYLLVTPEELQQVKRIITQLNSEKVKRRLG